MRYEKREVGSFYYKPKLVLFTDLAAVFGSALALYMNADPDPAFQMNADPCGPDPGYTLKTKFFVKV
jgi:hypothetical protein